MRARGGGLGFAGPWGLLAHPCRGLLTATGVVQGRGRPGETVSLILRCHSLRALSLWGGGGVGCAVPGERGSLAG